MYRVNVTNFCCIQNILPSLCSIWNIYLYSVFCLEHSLSVTVLFFYVYTQIYTSFFRITWNIPLNICSKQDINLIYIGPVYSNECTKGCLFFENILQAWERRRCTVTLTYKEKKERKKKNNADYYRANKAHRAKYMRVYRHKKKLDDKIQNALFDYELGILPIRTENWRIENG